MAHKHQLEFVRIISTHLATEWSNRDVLEVGSFDVNGSIRGFFKNSRYMGIDLVEGPGVDLVSKGEALDLPDGSFDLSISCECFEHNPNWFDTFINMYRMTREGGVVVFTCATTGRPEHGTDRTNPTASPGTQSVGCNYYKNLTERDFRSGLDFSVMFDNFFFQTNKASQDLFFFGMKKGRKNIFHSYEIKKIQAEFAEAAKQIQIAVDNELRQQYRYPQLYKALAYIAHLPSHAATSLPDRQYQDFLFYYLKLTEAVKKRALKFIN